MRAHRRTQQRYRRPGSTVEPPPPELRAVEKTATIAGAPAAEVIVQLDRLLRHLAATTDEPPKLDAVEIGKETVTLHLAEPRRPDRRRGRARTSTWSAELDSPVGDEDVLPPYPLLAERRDRETTGTCGCSTWSDSARPPSPAITSTRRQRSLVTSLPNSR
ncbi:MAG: hypothetical protein V9F00_17600 [Nocardioides sp.]